MITAVDTSILLDVLLDDPQFARPSFELLERQGKQGALLISPIAFAETASVFEPTRRFKPIADELGLSYSDFPVEAATLAGALWQRYRRRGGSRTTIMADFLIGAHAVCCADALATRDRGYFRDYFEDLTILTPH